MSTKHADLVVAAPLALAAAAVVLNTLSWAGTRAPTATMSPATPRLAAARGSALGHGRFVMHVLTFPDAAFVNAFIVETQSHVVVIDAGFSPEHGARIRALVDSLGKPIKAVLLTHGHVDHYGGVSSLRGDGVAVITGVGVARQIDAYDTINYARFGMAPPPGNRRPDRVMGDGEKLLVDGVTFTLHDAGPGESYDDVWWRISASDRDAAVLGDLAMYGIPPFLQSGHSGDWIRSLRRVQRALPAGAAVYIGHDVAAFGAADPRRDARILDWQIERLEEYRNTVAAITGRERLLTPAEIRRVVEQLQAVAPENLPHFGFLVSTSANVLAAELIAECQKEAFETKLQNVLKAFQAEGS